jgi:hypothetical protein
MVTFDPDRATQGLSFELQHARHSSLVADMEKIRQGTSIEGLAGDAPLLDRWAFAARPAACLVGVSSGHPILEGTGRLITTSDLILISQDGAWARTLSRWYRLGDPLPAHLGS